MNDIEKYLYNGELKFYPYKIFEVNNLIFLISHVGQQIFQINQETLDFLDCKNDSCQNLIQKFEKNKLLEFLNTAENNFIIKTYKNIETLSQYASEQIKTSQIKSITLMVCQECNLRCKYCYGEGGEYNDRGIMTIETAKKAVDFLFEESTEDRLSIVFFGGEPLMQYHLIKSIVKYADEKASSTSKEINYAMTSNVTLLDDDITHFLASHKFSITVSIDGEEESNNKTRYYVDGKGAYENIIKGISLLDKYKIKYSARATVCSENSLNLFRNLKFLLDKGFVSIYFSPAINMMNEADYKIYISELIKVTDYYFNLLKENQYERANQIRNISTIISRIHTGGVRKVHCGSGCNAMAVDINGELYPCHRFVMNKHTSLGSIPEGINTEKFNMYANDMLLSNSACDECWAVVLCGGGCPYENFQATNHINVSNSLVCKISKKVYQYILVKYLSLSSAERDQYFANINA